MPLVRLLLLSRPPNAVVRERRQSMVAAAPAAAPAVERAVGVLVGGRKLLPCKLSVRGASAGVVAGAHSVTVGLGRSSSGAVASCRMGGSCWRARPGSAPAAAAAAAVAALERPRESVSRRGTLAAAAAALAAALAPSSPPEKWAMGGMMHAAHHCSGAAGLPLPLRPAATGTASNSTLVAPMPRTVHTKG